MTDGPEEVGASNARTRLSELLRQTERGNSFLIRRRGKAVARLVPVVEAQACDLAGLLAAFQAIGARIAGPVRIRELIEEGRRY